MIKFIILELVFFTLATYCLFNSYKTINWSLFFVFALLMFATAFYNIEEAMIIGEKLMQVLEFLLG